MYTQGVNPNLNFHHLDKIKSVYQRCTLMDIHDRHPYAGALVFTAFSGSHQDAINKGMALQKEGAKWEVPYLPIDPTDIGQSYEAIIRINSQSGKGGVAYVMENEFGFHLPKAMHPEFGAIVQRIAEDIGDEVSSLKIKEEFEAEYFNLHTPIQLIEFKTISTSKNTVICELEITYNGQEKTLNGEGNGPIDACKNALNTLIPNFTLTDFSQHSISKGSTSKAVAYIQVENDHHHIYGCAVDENTTKASIKALISALNRLDKQSK